MPERIVLVDANSLIYRGYFALPPLTTTRGEQTNAIFGFTSILLRAWQDTRPDHVAACFDLALPTFRHERAATYKATRRPMPEDLRPQMERCKEVLDALAVPMYALPGYEADDLIGTLARQADERKLEVIILSGDLDTLQLVTTDVKLMTTRMGFQNTVTYDEAAIWQRYGLRPAQMVDYKALKGDTTDNVPGVPGVGDKTAARLIAQHGDLEGVYGHLDGLPARLRAALEEHRDQVLASRDLLRIVTDLPVELDLARTRRTGYDRERLAGLFRDLEFRTLTARLPPLEGPALQRAPSPDGAGQLSLGLATSAPSALAAGQRIADEAEVAQRIARAGAVAVHAELHPAERQPRLAGLGVAIEGAAWFLPVDGALPTLIARALADPGVTVVGHDLKTVRRALRRDLGDLSPRLFDTMVASYLVNAGRRQHLLEDLANERLRCEIPALPKPTRKEPNVLATIEERTAHVAACADAARQLAAFFGRDLDELGLRKLFDEVEMPLIDVLVEMEETGIALDAPYLATLSTEFAAEIARIEREAHAAVGHEFGLNSPKQLGQLLFEELRLPRGRRTATGYSTDAGVLEELRGAHPVVDLVLEYREVQKLKSTYADALSTLVDPATGRVHTHFNQTVATTGRLSSDSPNLQNIPIRTRLGRRIRRAFVAGDPEHVLVAADYSQIELRILAHMSDDPALLEAFRTGDDIHARTAALVLGIPRDAVTSELRRIAKTVNFGIIYGMSDFGLAWRMGMPRDEAQRFIDNYFRTYSQVRRYVIETKESCLERGYVETLLGRRRYIADITSPNNAVRNAAERMAINMPIQGTAADIMKIAMVRVRSRLRSQRLRARTALQVHDELVLEVPHEELESTVAALREEMSSAYVLSVPIVVDVRAGPNWDEMTPLADRALAASAPAPGDPPPHARAG
jgi:DNA polymerase-1